MKIDYLEDWNGTINNIPFFGSQVINSSFHKIIQNNWSNHIIFLRMDPSLMMRRKLDLVCIVSNLISRSHRGITGNAKADWLAKRGRGMDVSEVKLHYRNFFSHCKKINFEEWQSWWERTSRCKGRAYFNIQERVDARVGLTLTSRRGYH
ncbi:hypothetical protein QE152_g40451 [Popillia japonica]|uniref:RNase H type-1 domain-containing protein n=1 Tax=Popillia japonica TaxID=7064 RepID=A0AAW1HQS5_POPJA